MRRMRCINAAVLVLACMAIPDTGLGSHSATSVRTYIVRFADPPAAVYHGGETFFGGHYPATARRLKTADAMASIKNAAYLDYLNRARQIILGRFSAETKATLQPQHIYRYAYNGVALNLTAAQAKRMAKQPGVELVQPVLMQYPSTDAGPEWIGADRVWSGTAPGAGTGTEGELVIIGIIDSGITPRHESFADIGADGYDHENPRGHFFGLCSTGDANCNDKLIGIYDFTEEQTSGQDSTGHGTHVASIAAGNHVQAVLRGHTVTRRYSISGVAPHANIISYKACTSDNERLDIEAGCRSDDLVAAIDQAVADSVDVINYSIGGPARFPPRRYSVSQAMLNARSAGIVIAVSAGNEGPDLSSISVPATAPWVIAVANSTHNRSFLNKLTNFSGGEPPIPDTLVGAGFTSGYGPARIVHAEEFGHPLCGVGDEIDFPPDGSSNPFAPGTFEGQIVVCDRGKYARVTKGYNVWKSGAGGMVLANQKAQGASLVSDNHFLPTVHLAYKDSQKLRAWLDRGSGHMAEITGVQRQLSATFADIIVVSSSRGPASFAENALKPDVAAPGTNILGAARLEGRSDYQLLTGTSMASPHVAGSAALLVARHPNWTPTEIKSALMMTAAHTSLRDGADDNATPLDFGAGRVDVALAINSGLLMNETDFEIQGQLQALNLPSLVNNACFLECSWARTVTAAKPGISWEVQINASPGVEITVEPSEFSLADVGQSQTLHITADVRDADVGAWAFATLELIPTGSGISIPDAHIPIAAFATGGELRERIVINTASAHDSKSFRFSGLVELQALTLNGYGLVRAKRRQVQIAEDSSEFLPYDGEGGTATRILNVRSKDKLLVAEILDSSAPNVDLYLGRDTDGDGQAEAGEEICASRSPDSTEYCLVKNPRRGDYWVLVQNFRGTDSGRDRVIVTTAAGSTSGDQLIATGPARVPLRRSFSIRLTWNDGRIHSGSTWYGAVGVGTDPQHPDNVGLILVRLTRTGLQHEDRALAAGEPADFTLAGNSKHEGLYIDLPPNATRMTVVAGFFNGDVDLFARQGAPPTGNTTAELQASANASAVTGHNAREILVIDLDSGQVPARWFITPRVSVNSQTTFTLNVTVESTGEPIEPRRGLWFNTARPGHGIELNVLSGVRYALWFTYLENGQPAWYMAQAPVGGNIWIAPLYRFVWDGAQAYSTRVGELILTFHSPQKMIFSWHLFGKSGSEPFDFAEGILYEADVNTPVDHTGSWFAPAQPGWGDTVVTKGPIEIHTLYIYDGEGRPRWVQGSNRDRASQSTTQLLAYEGFCPGCNFVETQTAPAGQITANFTSQTTGTFEIEVTLPEPYGGQWLREDAPVEMLSVPVDGPR